MAGKRPSAKAIGLLIAVFVLGGVVGGLGTYLVGHMHANHHRDRIIDRLDQTLQLTPGQSKQIGEILSEGHKRWTAITRKTQHKAFKEARPQYDALHKEIRGRIRAVLTPEQKPKFDEFLKRLDAERKAREKRQGRGH
jgi:Spy/CpxP family protein refolding chaperone